MELVRLCFCACRFRTNVPGPVSTVGAHSVRPRAAEVVGPYGQTGRFPHFVGAAHLGRPGTARWGHRALQKIKRTFGYAVGAGVLTRPSRAVFHSWAGRPVSGPYRKANALPDMP